MNSASANNQLFLQQAGALLNDLQVVYREAEFDEQVQLKPQLDQAMITYSKARLAIAKNAIVCTPEDLKQMKLLRDRIDKAPNLLQLVEGIAKFALFMRSRFL
jgi:hypothetical protein